MPTTRIYARASTAKQALSPAAQSQRCQQYHADMRNLPTLMPQAYVDAATSGETAFDKRPAGHQLLLDCQPLDHVIVDACDRVGRDTPDIIGVMRLFTKRHVIVHVLDMLIFSMLDPNDPMAETMLVQMAAAAQLERKRLALRTKRGIHSRRALGYSAGNGAPVGFKEVPNPNFNLERYKMDRTYKEPRNLLVPDPDDQTYFDRAWALYLQGAKVPEAMRRLKGSVGEDRWPYCRLRRHILKRRKENEAEAFRQARQRTFER